MRQLRGRRWREARLQLAAGASAPPSSSTSSPSSTWPDPTASAWRQQDRELLRRYDALPRKSPLLAAALSMVIPGLGRMDQTQHMLGNIYIEIHGNSAAVESYFQAYHRLRGEGDHRFDIICAGRYVDRMEKRDGEWRIARRELAYDWYREYADSADWSFNQLNLPLQTNRAPTDISYAIIAEARARGGVKNSSS